MLQSANLDDEGLDKVLDPVHVPGRGAPKKRLHAKMTNTRSDGKCGFCKGPRHNRRKCIQLLEVANMSKFNFGCVLLINIVHGNNYILLCRISKKNSDRYSFVHTVGVYGIDDEPDSIMCHVVCLVSCDVLFKIDFIVSVI